MTLSPDGRHIASHVAGVLYLVPTAGGGAKARFHAKAGEEYDGFRSEWTPDSRSLILPKTSGDRIELWLVPMLDERAPRKIDVDTSGWLLAGGGFAVRPNGRHIAYTGTAGKTRRGSVGARELPAVAAEGETYGGQVGNEPDGIHTRIKVVLSAVETTAG